MARQRPSEVRFTQLLKFAFQHINPVTQLLVECIGGRFAACKGMRRIYHVISRPLPNTDNLSVDAQWIIAKKDYQAEEKKQKSSPSQKAKQDAEDATYHSGEDDAMRCILYIHGGKLNHGTVQPEFDFDFFRWILLWKCRSRTVNPHLAEFDIDTDTYTPYRYSTQRNARKINGRVFCKDISSVLKFIK